MYMYPNKKLFKEVLLEVKSKNNFDKTKQFMQHGDTSVYEHCIRVAWEAVKTAEKLGIKYNERELIRGALLHDYFLYDWHNKDNGEHDLHGFRHPYTALRNARRDFDLSNREENMILRHMFPLVPIPPKTREGWILCLVDKKVSFLETIKAY